MRSPIEIVAIVHGKRSISNYAVGVLFSTILLGLAHRLQRAWLALANPSAPPGPIIHRWSIILRVQAVTPRKEEGRQVRRPVGYSGKELSETNITAGLPYAMEPRLRQGPAESPSSELPVLIL